jgi:predicted N-acetyltransferase YhbS
MKIRPASIADIPALADIERDAGFAWLDAGAIPHWSEQSETTPRHLLEGSIAKSLTFVAIDDHNTPIGFLATDELDAALYIGEIDVLRARQRQGVGRKLMIHGLAEGRSRGLWGSVLVTDRFAPFNAPFYRTLGFEEQPDNMLPTGLKAIRQRELERGYSAQRRVGMVLKFVQ